MDGQVACDLSLTGGGVCQKGPAAIPVGLRDQGLQSYGECSQQSSQPWLVPKRPSREWPENDCNVRTAPEVLLYRYLCIFFELLLRSFSKVVLFGF